MEKHVQFSKKHFSLAELAEVPEFNVEMVDFNPFADANDVEELLPPARYMVRVTFLAADPVLRWRPLFARPDHRVAVVLAEIIGGPAGLGRRVPAWVTTRGTKRKCSEVESLLSALGKLHLLQGKTKTAVRLATALTSALEGEQLECCAYIDWRAEYQAPQPPYRWIRIDGANRFPKNENGDRIPEITIPSGEPVRARNFVRLWMPSFNGTPAE